MSSSKRSNKRKRSTKLKRSTKRNKVSSKNLIFDNIDNKRTGIFNNAVKRSKNIDFFPIPKDQTSQLCISVFSEQSQRIYRPSFNVASDGSISLTCPCGEAYGDPNRKSCKHVAMILKHLIHDSISSIRIKGQKTHSSISPKQLGEFMKMLAIKDTSI